MSAKADLENMNNRWKALGIEVCFPEVHHFASDKFRSKPSSLSDFYNYCSVREIEEENLQTLNRALKVASLVKHGHDIDSAIQVAWEKFPIVTR